MPDARSPLGVGWTTYRARVAEDVPRRGRRRARAVGSTVGAATLVVLVVIGVLLPWPDLRTVAAWVGMVLLALGIGAFGAACVPITSRPSGASSQSWSGSVMQAPERTERYLRGRAAPTIDPRDREAVLRDAGLLRTGLVQDVFRTIVLAPSTLFAVAGAWLLGIRLGILVGSVVFVLVRAGISLVRLGRVERARDLARSLPPTVDGTGRPHRRGDGTSRTPGTKLGLPGD